MKFKFKWIPTPKSYIHEETLKIPVCYISDLLECKVSEVLIETPGGCRSDYYEWEVVEHVSGDVIKNGQTATPEGAKASAERAISTILSRIAKDINKMSIK